jgi:glycerol-3-phosphate dehydrogenase (NAD(P)+)
MNGLIPPKCTISVLGAGAWGTGFAIYLAEFAKIHSVVLWTRDPDQARALELERTNQRYLPGFVFPSTLRATSDFLEAVRSDLLVLAVPSRALGELKAKLYVASPAYCPPLLILAKGFYRKESGLPGFLYEQWENWPAPVMVLSGPNFAHEVAQGLPAASTLAASSLDIAEFWVERLHSSTFRVYASDDRIGVSIGGAVKNVLGIAAGLSDGLKLGHNARAALITRGLAELMELTQRLGGMPETLFGLSGLGDVLLTCTGDSSRNRRVGLQLATGLPLARILEQLGHVAEGVYAADFVQQLADQVGAAAPVCRAVSEVLKGSIAPLQAVQQLLARSPRPERMSFTVPRS